MNGSACCENGAHVEWKKSSLSRLSLSVSWLGSSGRTPLHDLICWKFTWIWTTGKCVKLGIIQQPTHDIYRCFPLWKFHSEMATRIGRDPQVIHLLWTWSCSTFIALEKRHNPAVPYLVVVYSVISWPFLEYGHFTKNFRLSGMEGEQGVPKVVKALDS